MARTQRSLITVVGLLILTSVMFSLGGALAAFNPRIVADSRFEDQEHLGAERTQDLSHPAPPGVAAASDTARTTVAGFEPIPTPQNALRTRFAPKGWRDDPREFLRESATLQRRKTWPWCQVLPDPANGADKEAWDMLCQ